MIAVHFLDFFFGGEEQIGGQLPPASRGYVTGNFNLFCFRQYVCFAFKEVFNVSCCCYGWLASVINSWTDEPIFMHILLLAFMNIYFCILPYYVLNFVLLHIGGVLCWVLIGIQWEISSQSGALKSHDHICCGEHMALPPWTLHWLAYFDENASFVKGEQAWFMHFAISRKFVKSRQLARLSRLTVCMASPILVYIT